MRARIEEIQDIVENAQEKKKCAALRDRSEALNRFARSFLDRYEAVKQSRGWLDFDDLIAATDALLNTAEMAEWVLYKLDGGIDHILVDEAQDTSPKQWSVIAALEAEFTAGAGARQLDRTLFVVGDKKQSIFSFQGADPEGFGTSRARFARRLENVGGQLETVDLTYSFRSAEPILSLVDTVFAADEIGALGGPTRHRAMPDRPGRVEVWEFDPGAGKTEDPKTLAVVDRLAKDNPVPKLARDVAAHIGDLIGQTIPSRDGPRAVEPGDILVLVRGRTSPFFTTLIDALKAAGVPVAGADRLKIRDDIAVKDLLSTLRFLAADFDDLALAEALRSPLFGVSEADLYALAHGREGRLWERLASGKRHQDVAGRLTDLRNAVDFLRPYEILEKILLDQGGRARLVARLGSECEDAVDELLGQALQYEQSETPSLDGFLNWLGARDITVKRDMDGGRNEVRVMTVHGAKGLEAPIVIVPDVQAPRVSGVQSVTLVEGMPVWTPKSKDMPEPLKHLKDARTRSERQEHLRLLYVALTRAETWLIVCGAGSTNSQDIRWHTLVSDSLSGLDPKEETIAGRKAAVLESPSWPRERRERSAPEPKEPPALPDWQSRRAPPYIDARRNRIAPSGAEGTHALPGEYDGAWTREDALARGTLMHELIEHLPGLPIDRRPDVAERLSQHARDRDTIRDEAARVIEDPSLAWLFAPDTLREVAISARTDRGHVVGRIDLLSVQGDRVVAVDVKSNRILPASPAEIPSAILAQMGAYAAALDTLYPDRSVEMAILWTNGPLWMPLPHDLVTEAFKNPTSS